MDISVLAAVGSFAVSERILKPKATVLVVLGAILAYDLTTKTHDNASLRVYRGPALLAFSLAMCAYSLRMWRRNGVACDELLFLPGTLHGQRHGLADEPISPSASQGGAASSRVDEGDAAAGWTPNTEVVMARAISRNTVPSAPSGPSRPPIRRTLSQESSVSSIQEFANSWDEDETDNYEANSNESEFFLNGETSQPTNSNSPASHHRQPTRAERFRENHPQITRIGSFFFFRSSVTSTHSAEYAPSGPSVVGAAMDLTMPIMFNFHLYIEAYNHIDAYGSDFPAKILPLIFLSVLIFRSVIPPGRRMRFWGTMRYTFGAPWHRTRVRDCFVGDVVTSLVRPCQDVLFALSYYVTVVWGTLSGKYGLSESGAYLEQSWILHNVILPSAAILPLWWKFLQTLRQAYDTKKRWPHLGNSFKYLTASVIILYGMTHPEDRRSPWWLVSYGLATLYQILWDTLVDWELFTIEPRQMQATDCDDAWCTSISSYSPNSRCFALIDNCVRPVRKAIATLISGIPNYKQIKLRPKRLYKTEMFYYKIAAFNAVTRFTWMLCFIPAYHLSSSGEEHITTFSSDTNSYVGFLLPLVEILRRAFWGFLFLENQTIRMQDGNSYYSRVEADEDADEDDIEMEGSDRFEGSKVRFPAWLGSPMQTGEGNRWRDQFRQMFECTDHMKHRLFLMELSVWALAFVGFGIWASG